LAAILAHHDSAKVIALANEQQSLQRSDEQRRVAGVDALGALLQPRLERLANGLDAMDAAEASGRDVNVGTRA
jgi:hypothetical protein